MKVKLRTYILLGLAGLFIVTGFMLDLWFYLLAAAALTVYAAGRFFAFTSRTRQIRLDIKRHARQEIIDGEERVIVELALCSSSNVTGSFHDVVPQGFVLLEGTNPFELSLSTGERTNVRYVLTPTSGADLVMGTATLTVEDDLFVHAIHLTSTPLEVRRHGEDGGIGTQEGYVGDVAADIVSPLVTEASLSSTTGAGYELSHIRPFAWPDPQKNIHWKASAKVNQLMTKEFFSELEEEDRQAGAPIAVIIDTSGTIGDGAVGQAELGFAGELVERVADLAARKDRQVSLFIYDDQAVTRVGLAESPARALDTAFEQLKPTPSTYVPSRRKQGIIQRDVERFERQYETKPYDGDEGARFREVISYLYAHGQGYDTELRQAPAFRAIVDSTSRTSQPATIVLISDLENDLDPLVQGIRLATYRRSPVFFVGLFPNVFDRFDDALIALKDVYPAYERYKVQFNKVAGIPDIRAIEVTSPEYLRSVRKRRGA